MPVEDPHGVGFGLAVYEDAENAVGLSQDAVRLGRSDKRWMVQCRNIILGKGSNLYLIERNQVTCCIERFLVRAGEDEFRDTLDNGGLAEEQPRIPTCCQAECEKGKSQRKGPSSRDAALHGLPEAAASIDSYMIAWGRWAFSLAAIASSMRRVRPISSRPFSRHSRRKGSI